MIPPIVDVDWLKNHPEAVLADVRWYLDGRSGAQAYASGHLPGAVFLGFTGTPLLRKDRETSREVFGGYIHTYQFGEAVEDGTVLDLVYEARDIDQHLESQEEVDEWFEIKTRGLNDWQKEALKERWGTMQKVLSSASRLAWASTALR